MVNQTISVPELVKSIAADIAKRADLADRNGKLPSEDMRLLVESGYTKLSVPTEYGGYSLPLVDCIAAQLELAQGSPSTALVAAMQMQIFGNASEQRSWPEALFERLCQMAVQEGAIFNSIASEPTLGSPSRGGAYETNAELVNGEWVVNGHKNWATGGVHLTHMLVKLAIGDDSSILLIPNNIDGIKWVETWGDSLSLRASDSHDVYFENVKVPESNIVERVIRKGEAVNAWFPMTVTAVYLGAALSARDAVIKFALERVPTALGKPIATLPKIQRQIGEIDLMLQSARTLLLDACSAWRGDLDPDKRKADFARLIAAKTLITEVAPQATMKALHIAGGSSITHDLPLERHFRDSQAVFSHPPSGDIAYEMIGQHAISQVQNSISTRAE